MSFGFEIWLLFWENFFLLDLVYCYSILYFVIWLNELGSEKMLIKMCGVLIKIIFMLFIFFDVYCKILNLVILGKLLYCEIMYIYLYLL